MKTSAASAPVKTSFRPNRWQEGHLSLCAHAQFPTATASTTTRASCWFPSTNTRQPPTWIFLSMYSPRSKSLGPVLTRLSLYNNPDHSDLTIVLKDGREIKVNKNILCTANEWFKNAIGVGTHFAVSVVSCLCRVCMLMNVRRVGSQPGRDGIQR
jgi:hypothetical protein